MRRPRMTFSLLRSNAERSTETRICGPPQSVHYDSRIRESMILPWDNPSRARAAGLERSARDTQDRRRRREELGFVWLPRYFGDGLICRGAGASAGVDSNCYVIIGRVVLYEVIHAARAEQRHKVDLLTSRALRQFLRRVLLLASIQVITYSSSARLARRGAGVPRKKYFVVTASRCRRRKHRIGRSGTGRKNGVGCGSNDVFPRGWHRLRFAV